MSSLLRRVARYLGLLAPDVPAASRSVFTSEEQTRILGASYLGLAFLAAGLVLWLLAHQNNLGLVLLCIGAVINLLASIVTFSVRSARRR